jgi:DNA-binding protein Fis
MAKYRKEHKAVSSHELISKLLMSIVTKTFNFYFQNLAGRHQHSFLNNVLSSLEYDMLLDFQIFFWQ